MVKLGRILVETFDRYQRHNTPMLAAGLAFYSMLSLAPALWVVVAVAGAFIGHQSAREEVIGWAESLAGPGGAVFATQVLDKNVGVGTLATITGAIALLVGATGAFGALQDSLNTVWDVPPRDEGVIKGYLLKRLFSFGALLGAGALLLAALLTSATLSAVGQVWPDALPAPKLLLQWIDFAAAMILTTLVFAGIFWLLPDRAIPARDIWIGAGVTALLFTIGKTLLGIYLGRTRLSSAHSAVESLVVLLLWVYYSAQILLLGAEFTEVYAVSRRANRG